MKTSWSLRFVYVLCLLFVIAISSLHAGSATWLQNPVDGNWNNVANWTPGGPPNGSSDQATFGTSNQTAISLSASTIVGNITFSFGGNTFTIAVNPALTLSVGGSGVTNFAPQNFITGVNDAGQNATIVFQNNATAGNTTMFLNKGGTVSGLMGGVTKFTGFSTAGTGNFTNNGGKGGTEAFGGFTRFFDNSNAGNGTFLSHGGSDGPTTFRPTGGATQFYNSSGANHGTFIATGGEYSFANGGATQFFDNSGAARATLITHGGEIPLAYGGVTEFHDATTAATAILVCTASTSDAYPSRAEFFDDATAANSTITLEAGPGSLTGGGVVVFHDNATAGNTTVVNKGSTSNSFFIDPSATAFYDNATAGNATLIAEAGVGIGPGGSIGFNSIGSNESTARIEVFGNGGMYSFQQSLTIGSLEGDGSVSLRGGNLSVGSNNLSTTFSGVIQDSLGIGSSLTKVGTGTLTLAGANTYRGLTTVTSGKLQASHDGALGNGDVSLTTPGANLSLQGGAANNYVFDQAIVSLITGATINLNYKGTPDVVGFLILNGVSQPAGIYGGPASGAPHQLPQFTGAGTILVTTPVAVSRKLQGATNFDMSLPFTGASSIECRSGGANNAYQIVTTFGFPVTFNSASITSGTGNIGSVTGNGTATITINLTGVTNAQTLAVALSGVNYGVVTGDVPIRMRVLIGDTNGNGSVNASDVTQTKTQAGQPMTSSNYRADVNGNGVINASDVTLVKSRVGTALPAATSQAQSDSGR